jgi:hypothetical protein
MIYGARHSTDVRRRVTRLVGLTVAVFLGTFTVLMAHSASAQTLYFGGASVSPSVNCDADRHTLNYGIAMFKDPRYATQGYQYQYRLTNLATGYVSYSGVFSRTAYTMVESSTTGAYTAPTGGHWRVDYIVRFGTLYGYSNWSAWTPTEYTQTWWQYGLWGTAYATCYT